MRSYKKSLVVFIVACALVFVPVRDSKAIIPALIAGWLLEITGGSILVSDLVAGQAGIIAAVMWWDCNKFKFNAPCTSKQPIPSAQAPKPAITINLKPDAKRENPNPAKFNDPSPNSASPRDVTPKQEIAAGGTPAPPAPSGPVGVGTYQQDPQSVESGPTSQDTFQMQYNQSASRGDAMVAGVVLVKQMFAPTRAFPYVAQAVTCTYPTTGDQQPGLDDCTAKNKQTAATVQAYGNSSRYYYSRGGLAPSAAGTLRYVHVVVFYDQAADVTVTCDPGYQPDASDPSKCKLTDATLVKKPVDTPCEVLFDPATKVMMTDKSNPACDGLESSKTVMLASEDGSQSIEVKANAGNGFDITITKGDGSKTTLDTGIYDSGTGGYVIVHTVVMPPPDPNTGLGCGGPSQSACAVEMALDSETASADGSTRSLLTAKDATLKSQLDGIDPNRFQWTFIPQIPTAKCVNPSLKNPLGGGTVDMDICGGFNKFSFFLNGAFGLLCLYGCVRQIQNAMRV